MMFEPSSHQLRIRIEEGEKAGKTLYFLG